uniref:DDE Tnp4 domain-containing protein n=1 Tax=Brassica oleracea var. oleracea TaxID=109376 RepID=A0A0D3D6C0_BRAOL
MDYNPYRSESNFIDLLQSQEASVFGSSQVPFTGTQSSEETVVERRERRKWTPTDDIVLISACCRNEGSSRKRKYEDGAQSSTSRATETNTSDADEASNRPPGVKAAKERVKKMTVDEKGLSEFQTMWSIKQQDLAMKERLSKISMLNSLIGKQEPLSECGEAYKQKLITDLFSRASWLKLIAASESFVFGHKTQAEAKPCILRHKTQAEAKPCILRHKTQAEAKPCILRHKTQAEAKPCILRHKTQTERGVEESQTYLPRLSVFCKVMRVSIRALAYGTAADTVDEYLRLGETTTRLSVKHFVDAIINLFGDEYLRIQTPDDLQRLLHIGELRGFPGMIGIIDCMHWYWKNCPTAWKGQYSRGSGKPTIVLEAVASYDLGYGMRFLDLRGRGYHLAYYLTDGIYPKWTTFIQSIPIPQGPKADLFAQRKEAVRKNVERAFGVLQARFAIVKNPTLFWDKIKIGKIMRVCIILHNMIVENERDEYTQFDVSEFQQREGNGSSHVDLTYSTDIPTNIANMMGVRTRIRDRQVHQQLKTDLVENIWRKFGRDQDNN